MATAWESQDASWAVTEFAEAELGDARRTQRVISLATVLAQHPDAGLPEACGSRAALIAVFRWVRPDTHNAQTTPECRAR